MIIYQHTEIEIKHAKINQQLCIHREECWIVTPGCHFRAFMHGRIAHYKRQQLDSQTVGVPRNGRGRDYLATRDRSPNRRPPLGKSDFSSGRRRSFLCSSLDEFCFKINKWAEPYNTRCVCESEGEDLCARKTT